MVDCGVGLRDEDLVEVVDLVDAMRVVGPALKGEQTREERE